jgi:hypothetical protein
MADHSLQGFLISLNAQGKTLREKVFDSQNEMGGFLSFGIMLRAFLISQLGIDGRLVVFTPCRPQNGF